MTSSARRRAEAFCERFNLRVPVLEAPMAGACPVERSIAIARAGGMGGFGAVLTPPSGIVTWARKFRSACDGALQMNLWVPGPPPARNAEGEAALRTFLSRWGPEIPADAADAAVPDFGDQCQALLEARPTAASSIMGLFPPDYVSQLKQAGIAWFATVTTLREAMAAQAAGADAVIAQGFEAGGHRGTYDALEARTNGVGLIGLIPALADRLTIPIVAAGGIGDERGIVAALTLGASAVSIGTAFLRSDEADTPKPWADSLHNLAPEDVSVTRAFSGRPARAISNDYVRAAGAPDAPQPAPYPIQRALTARMRTTAAAQGDTDRMQMWAGQGAALAQTGSAGIMVERWWADALRLLA